jgi:hypothetical protein
MSAWTCPLRRAGLPSDLATQGRAECEEIVIPLANGETATNTMPKKMSLQQNRRSG